MNLWINSSRFVTKQKPHTNWWRWNVIACYIWIKWNWIRICYAATVVEKRINNKICGMLMLPFLHSLFIKETSVIHKYN